MARELIEKYVWIVDTIMRHGKISRPDLNELWRKSSFSKGNPLAERTFYHYRRSIEEIFKITIDCTPDGMYYIDTEDSPKSTRFTNWVLDSSVTTNAMQELGSEAGRVEMEDVPSARQFLPLITEAMRDRKKIVFTYAGFSRSRPEVGILFSPYFLKLYKQRWYMFGEKDGGALRTYALDRVTEVDLTTIKFKMPSAMKVEDVFGDIIGITASKADVRDIVIQTTHTRAKYLRALPLHHSQKEEIHDFYSIFRFRLKLNYELVSEIVTMGPDVKVLAPKELQMMVVDRLRETLQNYTSGL